MQFEYMKKKGDDGHAVITVYVPELDFAESKSSGDPNFEKVRELCFGYALRDDEGENLTEQENQELVDLFRVEDAMNRDLDRLSERYHVQNGVLYKDGDPLDSGDPWVKQVLRFRDEGVLDWAPLIRFQENLDANPEPHSRAQLFSFLMKYPITITEDGMLVLYKGVNNRSSEAEDYEDYPYESCTGGPDTSVDDVLQPNGKIKQGVGSVVTHPRSKVHFDPSLACSNGLHCGTYHYASRFGNVVLRVLVNPRDVKNVPDHDHKVRVCRYVVDAVAVDGEYQEAVLVQQRALYDGSAPSAIQDPAEGPVVPAEATYDVDEGEDPSALFAEPQNASDSTGECQIEGCEADEHCFGCNRHDCDGVHEFDPLADRNMDRANELANNQEVTPVEPLAPTKPARKRYPSPAKWEELLARKARRKKSIRALAPSNWVLTGDDPNERKSWEVQPSR